ncbi:MAG TPA: hypothetical protein VJH92_06155 [Candidatus Nanoarchaeia archaeon]|nr:hypothetical protein [Candidatus Nanoarchaeia archaeon]
MGGLITHLSAGLLGAIVIYFILHKLESPSKFIYGGVFILGNIIPDLVDFGILGIRMGVFDPAEIMKNPLFDTYAVFGHTFSNWALMALIFVAIVLFLYEIEKISKKVLVAILVSTALFLIGIFIHLRIDALIIETSYWV